MDKIGPLLRRSVESMDEIFYILMKRLFKKIVKNLDVER